jgi:hypothetical protein
MLPNRAIRENLAAFFFFIPNGTIAAKRRFQTTNSSIQFIKTKIKVP